MRISFIPKGWGALRLTPAMETMLRRTRRAVSEGRTFLITDPKKNRTRDALVRRGLVKFLRSADGSSLYLTEKAADILNEEDRLQSFANKIIPAIAGIPQKETKK